MSLRGAIIGFGNIAAEGHWPSYTESPDVDIVAIVDPSPSRQAAARAKKASIRVYDTVDELLAMETLDFVDICTPPASHTPLALQALAKGCHVLCEKPLALSVEDYARLTEAVKASERTLFTVHNWKYAPIFRKALEIVESGRLGSVWHVELFTLRNSHCKGATQATSAPAGASEDWRTNRAVAGGGILIDHGWHAFYLILNLVGLEPQRILAKMERGSDDPAALEEVVQALIEFPRAVAFMNLTWRAKMRRNTLTIQGERGSILVDDDRLLVSDRDGATEEIPFPSALSAGSHHPDWFRTLLPDFLQEIQDPAQRGRNFQEAGQVLALTVAAYESQARGSQQVPLRGQTASTRP